MSPSSTEPPSLLQILTAACQLPAPTLTAWLSVASLPSLLAFHPSEFSREDQSSNYNRRLIDDYGKSLLKHVVRVERVSPAPADFQKDLIL